MKRLMRNTLTPGGVSPQRLVCIGLAFLFLSVCPSFAESGDGGGLVSFLRGRTWQWFMDLFNFFILMVLIWKFVIVKLLIPALDEGISDIESRLSQEEAEKQKFLLRIEELKEQIAALPSEEQQKLDEAKQQSVVIKEQILQDARENELRILNQAEVEATAQLNLGVNDLKKKFFDGLVDEVGAGLSGKDARDSLKTYLASVMKGLVAK